MCQSKGKVVITLEEERTFEMQKVKLEWIQEGSKRWTYVTANRDVTEVEIVDTHDRDEGKVLHLRGLTKVNNQHWEVHGYCFEGGDDPLCWHVQKKKAWNIFKNGVLI